MPESELLLLLLTLVGVLIGAIAIMIYRRLGGLENMLRAFAEKFEKEDKTLHGRVSSLSDRTARVEARCESLHPRGGLPSSGILER